MSQENVELVRERNGHLVATGEVEDDWFEPDFVWDMSTFAGWPEKQEYLGVRRFTDSSSLPGLRRGMTSAELVECIDGGGDRWFLFGSSGSPSRPVCRDDDLRVGFDSARTAAALRFQAFATPEEALEAAGLSG